MLLRYRSYSHTEIHFLIEVLKFRGAWTPSMRNFGPAKVCPNKTFEPIFEPKIARMTQKSKKQQMGPN